MAWIYPGGLTATDFQDGYTNSGWQPWLYVYGSAITIAEDGTVTRFSVMANSVTAVQIDIKYGLYNSSGSLVVQSTGSTSSATYAWVDSATFSQAVTAGTYYLLVSSSNPDTNDYATYGYDTSGTGSYATEAYATAMAASETITSDDTEKLYGVRVDFTATSGPSVAVLANHYRMLRSA